MLCPYAHGMNEFRRKPHKFDYEPFPCENWKHNDYSNVLAERCSEGVNC